MKNLKSKLLIFRTLLKNVDNEKVLYSPSTFSQFLNACVINCIDIELEVNKLEKFSISKQIEIDYEFIVLKRGVKIFVFNQSVIKQNKLKLWHVKSHIKKFKFIMNVWFVD